MTRLRGFVIGAGLVCATCAWFTVSRAGDEAVTPGIDSVAELLGRIEKLEKRIAVLEERDNATRQVNAVDLPREPSVLPVPVSPPPTTGGAVRPPVETARPAARIWLLKKSEQK